MKSFRHELEDLANPVVEKDILELAEKISLYRDGKLHEDKFKSLRLARGVYGQRQPGVQMIRIKILYGQLTPPKLVRIAAVSDEFSNGVIHATTRQDLQIHHVSLERTPELWAELEKDKITLREACGNTVRNITASAHAGVDAKEPFDVTPYADAFFNYFLRHPAGQDLGRKLKIAFSSSEKDSAFAFMHDIGFIPKIRQGKRGFKVLIGGGLGAQPFLAKTAFDFLEEEKILPFTESLLRVFDRYGERLRRNKARLKYLLEEMGLEQILKKAEEELPAVSPEAFKTKYNTQQKPAIPHINRAPGTDELQIDEYDEWLKSNVREQKQKGFFTVVIKLKNGNFTSEQARKIAAITEICAASDFRITIEQNILLRFVIAENLPYLFSQLQLNGLSDYGADTLADITSCPGTNTCNLGITNSYGASDALEKLIKNEFYSLLYKEQIKIKISGCMNACGQHSIAQIGFHGSTIRHENKLIPAMQLLLGGGPGTDGDGRMADKVIKLPTKKAPDALKRILHDFISEKKAGEPFNSYYDRKGKIYFYDLLKPLSDMNNITTNDFIDWGHDETYTQAIGVGECAGVAIDLLQTLLFETEEKLDQAVQAFDQQKYADSIYFSYSTFVTGAKALLLQRGEKTNTQAGIIADFDRIFSGSSYYGGQLSFSNLVFQIKEQSPEKQFAHQYLIQAKLFFQQISKELVKEKKDVIS